jgi:hypothetical protein
LPVPAELTVVTVLKTGGEYELGHVYSLRDQVARHLSLKHRFVCLSDASGLGVETIPLINGWPGWWSKMEMFYPGRFDTPVLYLDLDTAVVDSIDDIVLGHGFTVLRNFWRPDAIGSGIMAWDQTPSDLYINFAHQAEQAMRRYTRSPRLGDQGFIQDHFSADWMSFWQEKHPGRVVSYRKDVVPLGRRPRGASIICFGGKMRPWNSDRWQIPAGAA